MCPDGELNWRPFGSQASTQSTEPPQPGQIGVFFNLYSLVGVKMWWVESMISKTLEMFYTLPKLQNLVSSSFSAVFSNLQISHFFHIFNVKLDFERSVGYVGSKFLLLIKWQVFVERIEKEDKHVHLRQSLIRWASKTGLWQQALSGLWSKWQTLTLISFRFLLLLKLVGFSLLPSNHPGFSFMTR